MIDYRAEPTGPRHPNFSRYSSAVTVVAFFSIVLLYGTTFPGTGVPLFASPPDSSEVPPMVPDLDRLEEIASESQTDSIGQVSSQTNDALAGLTVGERLKRLDSLMLVVSPDSLEDLMVAYRQLLDSALSVRYGEPPTPSYSRNRHSSTPRSNSRGSDDPVAIQPSADVATSTTTQSIARSTSPTSTVSESPTSPAAAPSTRTPEEPPSTLSEAETQDAPTPAQINRSPAAPTIAEVTRSIVDRDGADPPLRQRSNDGYTRSTPRSSLRSNDEQSGTQPERNSSSATTSSRTTSIVSSITPRSNAGTVNAGETRSADGAGANVRQPRERAGRAERKIRQKRRGRMDGASSSRRMKGNGDVRRDGSRVRTEKGSLERKYTEGLAKFRAGHYRQAIELLRPVAAGSLGVRNTARYYLAVSLERTGKEAAALRSYRLLKGASGSIGEKSWIAVARLLAKSGNTAMARKELKQFRSSRSGSAYVAEADRMLRRIR